MEKKRKLNVLSISDKVRLIQLVEKGDRKKCEIANEFNIPPNTLSSIIKQKKKIMKFNYCGNMKKMRMTPYLDIDKCLLKWFTQCRDKNIPFNGKILLEKANEYAQQLGHTNFKASSGWLTNWKKRYDVVFRTVCGEKASVDTNCCSNWIKNLPVTQVTIQQAKDALKTLRNFVETTTDMDDKAYSALNNLEDVVAERSNIKQTLMTDF